MLTRNFNPRLRTAFSISATMSRFGPIFAAFHGFTAESHIENPSACSPTGPRLLAVFLGSMATSERDPWLVGLSQNWLESRFSFLRRPEVSITLPRRWPPAASSPS